MSPFFLNICFTSNHIVIHCLLKTYTRWSTYIFLHLQKHECEDMTSWRLCSCCVVVAVLKGSFDLEPKYRDINRYSLKTHSFGLCIVEIDVYFIPVGGNTTHYFYSVKLFLTFSTLKLYL